MVKVRSVTKQISVLESGDQVIHSAVDIEDHILNYYKDLFATANACSSNDLVSMVIPSLVTVQDNEMCTRLPSLDDVKKVVFSMNGNGAPGHDGFGGFFFHKY